MNPHKRFFFVADDFGMNPDVNQSILLAHHEGVLTDAALMMGQPGTNEAIEIAHSLPSLAIGLHLHFLDSTPTLSQTWPWCSSPEFLGLELTWNSRMKTILQEEIRSQWELFQQSRLPLAFVNVHHHLHAHPWIARILARFLKEKGFSGWVRAGYPRFFSISPFKKIVSLPVAYSIRKQLPYSTPNSLWGIDRCFSMNPEEIHRTISRLTLGNHEFIFHPRHPHDQDTQCLIQLKTLLNKNCI